MNRLDPKNWQWWISCCWCVPLIGLLQSIIVIGPLTIYNIVMSFVYNLMYIPLTIFQFYRCIFNTRCYGKNIKIFFTILSPIPILIFTPLLTAFVSTGSVLLSVFGPTHFLLTNNHLPLLYGGITKCFSRSRKYLGQIRGCHEKVREELFVHFLKFPSTHPFDIQFFTLIFYIIMGCYGILLESLFALLYGFFFLIPAIIKLIVYLKSKHDEWSGEPFFRFLCQLPFLISILLAPGIVLVGYTFLVLYCFLSGALNVKVAIQSDLICNGFKAPFIEFAKQQIQINRKVFSWDNSCTRIIFCNCSYGEILSDEEIAQRKQNNQNFNIQVPPHAFHNADI